MAEHQKIDAFKLWCWRRLLRVTWTARRSKQSILKEINPDYSLKGLMLKLKLKLQYSGTWGKELTHQKRSWCWEKLKAGGEGYGRGGEGYDRGWDGWTALLTRWTWVWVNSWSWWWTGRPGKLQSMGLWRVGHNWVTELNWTKWNLIIIFPFSVILLCTLHVILLLNILARIAFFVLFFSTFLRCNW